MRVSMRTTGVIAVIVTAFLLTAPGASAATRAWWHMNETSGSTMHDAVGSADGTNHNVAKKRAGVWGSMAYGFNGWNSYVSVPPLPSPNPGWAKLTIKISVRFSSIPPQDYDLIRKGRSRTPGGDYKVEIARSGQALCLFGGSKATAIVIGGPALNDGTWHRISCIRGARSASLIVDGRVRRRVWRSVGSIANTATLFIGARPGSDWHKGRLDEARIIVG
jgi:concanavalin A-like lectin/glucanase superfamily protein